MISQPGCPPVPDASAACRKLSIDTDQVDIYDILFTVFANGGAQVTSTLVKLEVECSTNIKILQPTLLQPESQLLVFIVGSGP